MTSCVQRCTHRCYKLLSLARLNNVNVGQILCLCIFDGMNLSSPLYWVGRKRTNRLVPFLQSVNAVVRAVFILATSRWDRVCVELRQLRGPLSVPQTMHEWLCRSDGMILKARKRIIRTKTVPVPLCPSQIPCGLTWTQTQGSALGSQRH
jgi:hypothetical protein